MMTRSLPAAAAAVLLGLSVAGGQTPATTAANAPAKPDVRKQLTDAFGRSQAVKTPDDCQPIIETCEQALAGDLTPTNADYAHKLAAWAYNRRGELYAEQAATLSSEGKTRKANEMDSLALADFETAIQHDAGRWKAIHNRGVSQALHGKTEEALADFTQVIKLNADYANAWFNRGELRLERREFAEAVADYSESLNRKADDPAALLGRGTALLGQGKSQEALADLDRAVRIDNRNPQTISRRGDARQHLRMWEQAADDYRQAIKLQPDNAVGYRGAAWLMATCPEERFRNTDLALRTAQKAVDLSEGADAAALDALAAAFANAGRFDEALATITKAVEMLPESSRTALIERLDHYKAGKPHRQ